MRVFVIGATSGVGRLLAERLAADGHAVRGLARDPSRAPCGVEVVAGDLAELTASGFGETVRDSDVIVFATVVAEPRLRRHIVEVTAGDTPIPDAVGAMLA